PPGRLRRTAARLRSAQRALAHGRVRSQPPLPGLRPGPCRAGKESCVMSYVKGLRCRECGGETPVAPLHVCEICFGPLEVAYDYDAIRRVLTRELIESRPRNLWRYRELLPVDGEPRIGLWSGLPPRVRAH